ncbi:MAG: AI-2E family transporter [Phaeodactylibacter sp.]|uniref:AI-2E family transporter n=1 Tax=Phaeodactylibacter sp. TaxID=1940289 RepID=UPI0032ECB428
MQANTWTLDRIINILLYLGGIALFLWLLDYLSPYLTSFFIALFVAYLLEPVVRFFQQRLKVRIRWLAVLLTLVSLIGFLILVGLLVVPALNVEIAKMQALFEGSLDLHFESLLPPEVLAEIQAYLHSEELKALLTEENIYNYGVLILSYIWSGLSSAMGIVLGLFSIITFMLYLVFIMLFYNDFADNWEAVIPPAYREPAVMLVHDVEDGMQVYFRGQALVVFWVCILFATGFNLIGLPLGILLGIFVGLLNFVPYLQTLGLLPALLLAGAQAVETGESYWVCAGGVLLVFVVVQAVQEIILTPRILGNATGLNPAVILLALSVWGGLFGVIGMVIALPLTTLLINYYKRFVLQDTPLTEEE